MSIPSDGTRLLYCLRVDGVYWNVETVGSTGERAGGDALRAVVSAETGYGSPSSLVTF